MCDVFYYVYKRFFKFLSRFFTIFNVFPFLFEGFFTICAFYGFLLELPQESDGYKHLNEILSARPSAGI